MKRFCLLCERTSLNGNLYCQEIYCPAEMSPTILSYGEWLGDIEIVKPVSILRSSVLYEAMHQKQKVFLKVAHPGDENTARLKREAVFLSNRGHKFLPSLLPAYAGTTVQHDPYGRTMLDGHLLYYFMFKHVEGDPLRDLLVENPQFWIKHVGWIAVGLSTALNHLHQHGIYHFSLVPESVLVRFDDEPNTPRILLFDLGIVSDAKHVASAWHPFAVPPAYTAPELVDIDPHAIRPDYRTDVYGVGLLLYEMLVGEPPYAYKMLSDDDVRRAVQRNRIAEMNRKEDVESIANIALQTVAREPERRPRDAAELAHQLIQHVGAIPEEKKRNWPEPNRVLLVVAALLAVAFLVTLAISMTEFAL